MAKLRKLHRNEYRYENLNGRLRIGSKRGYRFRNKGDNKVTISYDRNRHLWIVVPVIPTSEIIEPETVVSLPAPMVKQVTIYGFFVKKDTTYAEDEMSFYVDFEIGLEELFKIIESHSVHLIRKGSNDRIDIGERYIDAPEGALVLHNVAEVDSFIGENISGMAFKERQRHHGPSHADGGADEKMARAWYEK